MYPEEIKNKIKEKLELFISRGLVTNKTTAIYFDVREIMAFLGFRTFHDDMHKYPTGLLCCSCKLAMHFITAKYSSSIGVAKIADGYSYFERFLPEQLPEFKSVISGTIVDQYGVEVISPLYHVFDAVDVPMTIIKGFGLDPAVFLGETLGQAVCLLGLIYKIPYDVNDSDESQNTFFNELRNATLEYTTTKMQIISGKETQRLMRHDSYGNEYFEDMDYNRIMERVIAAKEIFFEG